MRKFILFLYAIALVMSISACRNTMNNNNTNREERRLRLQEIYAKRQENENGRLLRTFHNLDESNEEPQQ